MPDARTRLKELLDLAAEATAAARAKLVEELADLLLDWPEEYAFSMRAHFDLLLEKAAEDVEPEMRAMLARRFAAQPDAPIGLLNRLFFDAPDDVKPAILRRNALAHDGAGHDMRAPNGEETDLVAAARGDGDPAAAFAHALGIDDVLATRILAEPSGEALAAACKGAHLKRTTFSALALLFAPNADEREQRLTAYDAVPQDGAESLVRFWRAHPHRAERPGKTQAA